MTTRRDPSTTSPIDLEKEAMTRPITAPIREAVYERGVWTLAVDCPGCGHTHHHGGGSDPDPQVARGFLGHRAAHCPSVCTTHGGHARLPAGYTLTDPEGVIDQAAGCNVTGAEARP